jgi:phosphorylcholine metabolism protein LicD
MILWGSLLGAVRSSGLLYDDDIDLAINYADYDKLDPKKSKTFEQLIRQRGYYLNWKPDYYRGFSIHHRDVEEIMLDMFPHHFPTQ